MRIFPESKSARVSTKRKCGMSNGAVLACFYIPLHKTMEVLFSFLHKHVFRCTLTKHVLNFGAPLRNENQYRF